MYFSFVYQQERNVMYVQLLLVRRQKPWRGPDPAHLIHAAGPQKYAKQSYCHKYVKQDLTNKLLWGCLIP